jgi:hypothetical protein
MTKLQPHTPPSPGVQIYRYPSSTVQSGNAAGGKVPVDHYTGKGPAPRSGTATQAITRSESK